MKLKKGDNITILTGKDRGKSGKVEKLYPKTNQVLIPGLNQYKKHQKPQGDKRPGDILTLDRPFQVSKVAIVCPKCKLPTKVGYTDKSGKKVRICRKCDNTLD